MIKTAEMDVQDTESSMKVMIAVWVGVGILIAAIVAMAVHKALPMLYPNTVEVAPLDLSCDLRKGNCLSELSGGGKAELGLLPRTIPAMQPLDVEVRLEGIDAKRVELDFSGVDMNMGFNRIPLEEEGAGQYAGVARLAPCIRSRMEWEARLLITTNRGVIAVPYRFVSVKNPG